MFDGGEKETNGDVTEKQDAPEASTSPVVKSHSSMPLHDLLIRKTIERRDICETRYQIEETEH